MVITADTDINKCLIFLKVPVLNWINFIYIIMLANNARLYISICGYGFVGSAHGYLCVKKNNKI
jgi:hypothetical protein